MAPKLGEQAPDLDLLDESGRPLTLASLARHGPLLLVVFSTPEDEAAVQLLCAYRDATLALRRAGVSLCAVGHADPAALSYLRAQRGLAFPVLADPDGTALTRWGMLDQTGLFLLDKNLKVRQRSVGVRATADAMVAFLRRGQVGQQHWRERIGNALSTMAHALRQHRLAR